VGPVLPTKSRATAMWLDFSLLDRARLEWWERTLRAGYPGGKTVSAFISQQAPRFLLATDWEFF
jgi:hypothetical protein